MITAISPRGELGIEESESVVLVAYPDLGGVITIGAGLTMLSKSFARIWRAEHGGKALKKGDKITRGDARRYMRAVLNEEFVPATVAGLAPKEQHVLDGGVSVTWNCGTGAVKWKWAQAIKAGRIAEGCRLLLTTAVTAAGLSGPVRGLQLRRKREARLIEFGEYSVGIPTGTEGTSTVALSTSPEEIKEYQKQLTTLGFYRGLIDGENKGKGSLTDGAVRNFQRSQNMKVDGRVGPATRSALKRAVAAKNQATGTVGGATSSAGAAGFGFHLDGGTMLLIAGGVVLVLVVGFIIWNNRGRILGVRTPA